MQWTPGGPSNDVEDRRSGGGFGGFGLPHIGIGGFLLLLILSFVFHRNFFALISGNPAATETARVANSPAEEREMQFVSFVLDDVQKTWDNLLPAESGKPYRHAKLVLFRDQYPSACGEAETAVGPFYCPSDEKVYLDMSFFDELSSRFGAPGEFAQAYVIAHEIGHHVQKILGIEQRNTRFREQDPSQANALSVELELQADCLAGVWGNSTQQRKIVDRGDIQAGLRAAAAVGDDRLQRMSGRGVNPETFTHGSSQQRTHWFEQGLDSGMISACDVSPGGRRFSQ